MRLHQRRRVRLFDGLSPARRLQAVCHGAHVRVTGRDMRAGCSCGVSFLVRQGSAILSVEPTGATWRRLHGHGRPQAAWLPLSERRPRGCRCLCVVCTDGKPRAKKWSGTKLCRHLWRKCASLLVGDFNGFVTPAWKDVAEVRWLQANLLDPRLTLCPPACFVSASPRYFLSPTPSCPLHLRTPPSVIVKRLNRVAARGKKLQRVEQRRRRG